MNCAYIVREEYRRDAELKEEDVNQIVNWLSTQPHLPTMTEQEILWFLKSCYYSIESVKTTIDKYFTLRTSCPELFGNRFLEVNRLKNTLDLIVYSIIPKKTPDGYTAIVTHLQDPSPENFNFTEMLKIFDMLIMIDMFKNGSSDGLLFCLDMEGISFAHVTRIKILALKNFFYYLQECMPIRLKGIHFFNISSVMDTILKMIKPLMSKSVFEMVHLHQTVHGLTEFVPLEYLPSEFGGTYDSLDVIQDRVKNFLTEGAEFFAHQDEQMVNESKRLKKSDNSSDIYGVEGTFKKLELD